MNQEYIDTVRLLLAIAPEALFSLRCKRGGGSTIVGIRYAGALPAYNLLPGAGRTLYERAVNPGEGR